MCLLVLLLYSKSLWYQALSYEARALQDLHARWPPEGAIVKLDARPLPHYCSVTAPPMNSVFEVAIHLLPPALPLSWICLPSLVHRKEEHLHIGGAMRTCHCRPTPMWYIFARLRLVDVLIAVDIRALLASSLSVSHGEGGLHR